MSSLISKQKSVRDPHTRLEYTGPIHANSNTGVVTGIGLWHDDDNNVPTSLPVLCTASDFTPDQNGNWLVLNMYAEP